MPGAGRRPQRDGMRQAATGTGFVLMVMGISGVIDHLAVQPVMGGLLNLVHRQVFERFEVFDGHELVANVGVAVLGVLVMLVADRDG